MKTKTDYAPYIIFALCLALFAGCSVIDYKVFKSKYPSAGFWSWVWSRK